MLHLVLVILGIRVILAFDVSSLLGGALDNHKTCKLYEQLIFVYFVFDTPIFL